MALRGVRVALLLCFALLECGRCGGKDGAAHRVGKHVVKLKEEKFDNLLKQPDRPPLLVEFFAPWCGACRNFAPTYARAGELAKQRGLALKVAAVDCDAEKKLAERFQVSQFPTVMLLSKDRKQPLIHQGIPRSAESLLEWVDLHTGDVIQSVASEDMVPPPILGLQAIVVVYAPHVPEDLKDLAEATRKDAKWFQVLKFATDLTVEIRHHAQEPVSRVWPEAVPHAGEEQLEKERVSFIRFFLMHRYPRFMPVHNPREFVKSAMDDNREEFGIIWVLLNTSLPAPLNSPDELAASSSCSGIANDGAGESGSCSANSGSALVTRQEKGNDQAGYLALEKAAKPWRRMFTTAGKLLGDNSNSKLKNRYRIAYVDGTQHAVWAEHKLYAWDFPKLVLQRTIGFGSSYFFADGKRMPNSTDELVTFVRDAEKYLNVSARRKSQRPRADSTEASAAFQTVVADNIEEALRSVAGTALYVYKGIDKEGVGSDDQEVRVHDDEIEALEDLSAMLRRICERPPALMAIDARHNDIPMSLYAMADFGMLSLPGLYFIPSDLNKTKLGGAYWGHEISKYEPPKLEIDSNEDDTLRSLRGQLRVLSVDLQRAVRWVIRQAAGVPGLSTPDENATIFSEDIVVEARGPPVAALTERDFARFTTDHPSAFIEFYAPWCGHCKRFAPTFEAAARSARRAGGVLAQIAFAKVDGTSAEKLVKKYNVESYPTLLFLSNGALHPYTGGQKKNDILNWLHIEMIPTVRLVDAEEAKVAHGIIFHGPPANVARQVFSEAAEHYKHTLRFLAVEAAETTEPVVILRLPGRSEVTFKETFDRENIIWWIATETVSSEPVPTESEQTGVVRKVVGRTFAEEVFTDSHVIIEVYAEWCSHCKDLAPIYEEFALSMRADNWDLVVAKIDGEKNGIPFDGFDREGYPTIFHLAPNSHAPVKVKARTLAKLQEYVKSARIPRKSPSKVEKTQSERTAKDQAAGSLLESFTSEPVPSSQTGPVLQVVFKSFIQDVFRDDRSTLLEVYSPICPHCKAVAPQYKQLAERLASERPTQYMVAKIDATKNDIPFEGFAVKGYPTLFYIKAGEKKPMKEFVGSMIVEQMIDFLEL